METKQESLGVRGESLETDSQQHMHQRLRNSNSVNDSQVRLQLRGGGGSHAMLGEESGSQLAARLNSSTFGTEQVLAPPLHVHAVSSSLHSCDRMPPLTCAANFLVLPCSICDPGHPYVVLIKALISWDEADLRGPLQILPSRLHM